MNSLNYSIPRFSGQCNTNDPLLTSYDMYNFAIQSSIFKNSFNMIVFALINIEVVTSISNGKDEEIMSENFISKIKQLVKIRNFINSVKEIDNLDLWTDSANNIILLLEGRILFQINKEMKKITNV